MENNDSTPRRFEFDGAEGIAFWVGDSDRESTSRVMFDELDELVEFLGTNFPGLVRKVHPAARTTISSMQAQVRAFHEAMGQPVGTTAHPLPPERVPVRVELVREEFEDELIEALQNGDMVETVDACIDILYVTFGLLVEMGVNAEPLFDEVHRSNMSKFGADGKPIIAGPNDPDGIFEGRVKKGPNYSRPQLGQILVNGHANLEDLER